MMTETALFCAEDSDYFQLFKNCPENVNCPPIHRQHNRCKRQGTCGSRFVVDFSLRRTGNVELGSGGASRFVKGTLNVLG